MKLTQRIYVSKLLKKIEIEEMRHMANYNITMSMLLDESLLCR